MRGRLVVRCALAIAESDTVGHEIWSDRPANFRELVALALFKLARAITGLPCLQGAGEAEHGIHGAAFHIGARFWGSFGPVLIQGAGQCDVGTV